MPGRWWATECPVWWATDWAATGDGPTPRRCYWKLPAEPGPQRRPPSLWKRPGSWVDSADEPRAAREVKVPHLGTCPRCGSWAAKLIRRPDQLILPAVDLRRWRSCPTVWQSSRDSTDSIRYLPAAAAPAPGSRHLSHPDPIPLPSFLSNKNKKENRKAVTSFQGPLNIWQSLTSFALQILVAVGHKMPSIKWS